LNQKQTNKPNNKAITKEIFIKEDSPLDSQQMVQSDGQLCNSAEVQVPSMAVRTLLTAHRSHGACPVVLLLLLLL
jgi:hypothetical protein